MGGIKRIIEAEKGGWWWWWYRLAKGQEYAVRGGAGSGDRGSRKAGERAKARALFFLLKPKHGRLWALCII
jgi:hypothetical protein